MNVRDNIALPLEELTDKTAQEIDALVDQKLELVSKKHVAMGTLFKKVSVSFPADIKVDVSALEIDERNLLIKGTIYQGDINQVAESLKATSFFTDVQAKNDNGQFEVKGKVVVR
jgi:hypothetical protein